MGKTSILSRLFPFNIEVVSADSAQVYRYMDIGTAKPRTELVRRVPHHLISIKNPDQQFSVGEFVKKADTAVQEIAGRGKVPVLSGGTAFYFKNFAYGLPETPVSDPSVRCALRWRIREDGLPKLFAELKRIDPDYSEKIGCGDEIRIIRAMEIYQMTGKPVSEYRAFQSLRSDKYSFLLIGLNRSRADLYARIEKRVDGMFERGLTKEVKSLVLSGYSWRDPGLRAIGYREYAFWREGCLSLAGVRELIKQNTRRYAKRQLSFFQTLSDVRWYQTRQEKELTEDLGRFLKES